MSSRKSNSRFYITTPIYYINDRPHIGHAYTTIIADVLARYHRMCGKEVVFVTGTDENSQKSVEAAKKSGVEAVGTYIDEMAAIWEQTWDSIGITNTDFIRTTQPRHIEGVRVFYEHVFAAGDIYKGEYVGLYCVGCEAFYKESDLDEQGHCPDHKTPPQKLTEENWFFKLSAYREKLLAYIEANPDFVQPVSRRNEVVNYITHHMEDISISRQSQEWGIPVPNDETQVLYVWFDALLNYITALGYGADDRGAFENFWPADIQLVGKDILKFHCALWPAMLMSAGVAPPKQVFAHGFFTINGQKMSKTLGNVIDPVEIGNQYGLDALRYFFMREIKFGEDGDFSTEKLAKRYQKDLGDELGNLVSRVVTMMHKFAEGAIPKTDDSKLFDSAAPWKTYQHTIEKFDFFKTIEVIWGIVGEANRLITDEKPWELAKTNNPKLGGVLYYLADALYHIAWMLTPIMPETADKMLAQLGCDVAQERARALADVQTSHISTGQSVGASEILFPKHET